PRSLTLLAGIGAIALAACSSPAPSAGPSTGHGGSTSSSGASSTANGVNTSVGATGGSNGAGGSTNNCPAPGVKGSGADENIGVVKGNVVDLDGKPIAQLVAQVCGLDKCINAETGADGAANVMVNQHLKQPAFKYGGNSHARFATPLTMSGDVTF